MGDELQAGIKQEHKINNSVIIIGVVLYLSALCSTDDSAITKLFIQLQS